MEARWPAARHAGTFHDASAPWSDAPMTTCVRDRYTKRSAPTVPSLATATVASGVSGGEAAPPPAGGASGGSGGDAGGASAAAAADMEPPRDRVRVWVGGASPAPLGSSGAAAAAGDKASRTLGRGAASRRVIEAGALRYRARHARRENSCATRSAPSAIPRGGGARHTRSYSGRQMASSRSTWCRRTALQVEPHRATSGAPRYDVSRSSTSWFPTTRSTADGGVVVFRAAAAAAAASGEITVVVGAAAVAGAVVAAAAAISILLGDCRQLSLANATSTATPRRYRQSVGYQRCCCCFRRHRLLLLPLLLPSKLASRMVPTEWCQRSERDSWATGGARIVCCNNQRGHVHK